MLYLFYRGMLRALNPRYKPPSENQLSVDIIPAWYSVEVDKLTTELTQITHAAATSDGWTSASSDHYITVTVHYIQNFKLKSKVLETKVSYDSQTGKVIANQ